MSRVASGIAIQGNTQGFADFKARCRKWDFPHPQPLSQEGEGSKRIGLLGMGVEDPHPQPLSQGGEGSKRG